VRAGAHDDIANAIAGLVMHLGGAFDYNTNLDWICGPDDAVIPRANTISEKAAWARKQLHDTGPGRGDRFRRSGHEIDLGAGTRV
jgi:hypothetical protein